MKNKANEPTNCPACKVSLLGDKIPADISRFYGGTHWKREQGVVDPLKYDGVYYYECPDCAHTWGGYRALRAGAEK